MRIAQIAPLAERVPPKKYGGTERVVFALCEELVARGHQVTLFASGDSITSANLSSVYPKSLREAKITDPYGPSVLNMLHIGQAYEQQENFDIIHDHNGYLSLPTAQFARVPVVMTAHGLLTTHYRRVFEAIKGPAVVIISEAQSKTVPDINHIATIPNGLDMENFPFSDTHDGYLLYVGRISMEKGIHFAIEAAQYLNLPLIIAAKLESFDVQYFNEYIGPKLSDEQIRWIGEIDEKERNELMSKALCFLHPVTWKEPFGLTMIEAMACGCPVVAFNKGSVPEVVVDGRTGFVVEDVEEMIGAIAKIDQIDRAECRRYALENFSATLMADRYEEVYYQLVSKEDRKNKNFSAYIAE